MRSPRRAHSVLAFTLVELLIVVIILAILAAVAVPQFAGSTDDAKLATLDANLTLMRDAIRRYQIEHPRWPGKLTSQGGSCPAGGSAGTGLVNSAQALADQLMMYTDINGRACTTKDATFRFGPYLRSPSLPANPVTGSSAVDIETAGTLGLQSTLSDLSGGWKYDVWTGEFIADDEALDDR